MSLESILEEQAHEDFGKLTVSKRKSPETEVRSGVRYGTENEFNSFDHLMDEVLTESMGFMVAHVLELLVERLHLVLSLLDELVTFADFLSVSNSLIATASVAVVLDTWSITISDVSELDFILSWVILVGSEEDHWLDEEHDWDEKDDKDQKNKCDFELLVLVAIWNISDPLLLDTFWLTEGEDHDNHNVDYTRSALVLEVTSVGSDVVISSFTLRIVVEFLARNLSSVLNIDFVEPFGNDESVHPAEETPKDDESSDDLGDESGVVSVEDSVGTLDEDSHAHVDNTEDDGHLHLNVVDEGKFVAGKTPNWILTHQVGAVEV